jgi:hypothetical protein
MHELARRLEERLSTIERIMSAENPGWRTLTHDAMGGIPAAGMDPRLDGELDSLRSLRK